MTNVNISESVPQKPTDPPPATPQQQNQDNPAKPVDKPGEQK